MTKKSGNTTKKTKAITKSVKGKKKKGYDGKDKEPDKDMDD